MYGAKRIFCDKADCSGVQKTTGLNLSFHVSMGYKKDIFAVFADEFELSHIFVSVGKADTLTSSLLLLTYYFKIDKVFSEE